MKAVLFDLDGTLVDSYDAITLSLNHARQALGHPLLAAREVRGGVGFGLERLIAGFFPAADRASAIRLYREHHAATCVPLTRVYPGVREGLSALHSAGLKLGVATNKSVAFAHQLLPALGLEAFFAAVRGGDQVARPKPAPDLLERVLADLGVRPADAVYVGDMAVDVAAGAAAGIPVIGVATGSATAAELLSAGARGVVRSLQDLPRELGLDHRPLVLQ